MQSGAPALLECRAVTRRFGSLVAVDNLSLKLEPSRILGIGGTNGAGKTTLFDLISGFIRPDSGEIFLFGERIDKLPPHEICQRGLARTFQANAAFDSLTAFENVYAAAHFGYRHRILESLMTKSQAVRRAREALEFVGLAAKCDEPAATLSVFDRKRLMIASAVSASVRCLLMDEPVGGLTPKEIDAISALVLQVRDRGIAIVVIEHVMRFLVSLSDQVLIMQQGRELFFGTPAEMVADTDVTRVYLGKRATARVQAFMAERRR